MDVRQDTREAQAQLWNGTAGRAWVDAQDVLDRMFEGCAALLVEAAAAQGAVRVLDVGCGTGAVSLALARRAGVGGRTLGVDVSTPMVEAARERAKREGSRAEFVVADAETHAFEAAAFDAIVSRFGVMFFGDPVAAFRNLRGAVRPGGTLHALAWRAAADNPFMTAAERAAAPLLPGLPARSPDGPGQFAFADDERVRRILADAGWAAIDVRACDIDCAFPAAALDLYLTRLGPVGLVLQQADAATRERVTAAVRAAFDRYVHGDEVRFTAACWMISARKAQGR